MSANNGADRPEPATNPVVAPVGLEAGSPDNPDHLDRSPAPAQESPSAPIASGSPGGPLGEAAAPTLDFPELPPAAAPAPDAVTEACPPFLGPPPISGESAPAPFGAGGASIKGYEIL